MWLRDPNALKALGLKIIPQWSPERIDDRLANPEDWLACERCGYPMWNLEAPNIKDQALRVNFLIPDSLICPNRCNQVEIRKLSPGAFSAILEEKSSGPEGIGSDESSG